MKGRKVLYFALVFFFAVILAFSVFFFSNQKKNAKAKEWPVRPINILVGWSAGGTSDTTVRALAQEMSDFLKVDITVNNIGGANGGISYQNVFKKPADGYTLFGGAQVQATYPITKQATISWEEFYPFPAAMGTTTIYVRADSEYDDLPGLIETIKKADGKVKFGSTSRGGNGSIFGNALAQAAGVADKVVEVPYNGGREAGRYLISREVEFISVSLGDISDWAEAGRIKPLANLYTEDYLWHGIVFPAVTNYYPELAAFTSINPYWGVAVKRDTPAHIVEKLAAAFAYAVSQDRFKNAISERGVIVAPILGSEADEATAKVGSGRGWAQFEYGIVKTSPAEFNIPKVTDWKWPSNDAAANVAPWPEGIENIIRKLAN